MPIGADGAEVCRGSMKTGTVALAVLMALLAGMPVFAQESKLRRLTAAEIRSEIIGRVITDDSHWSDTFQPDGVLKAYELGRLQIGSWKIADNELCLTRKQRKKTATECYEIWLSNDRVEYRRDGVTVAEGFLRAER